MHQGCNSNLSRTHVGLFRMAMISSTFRCCISLATILCLVRMQICSAFLEPSWQCYRRGQIRCSETNNDRRPSSYETSDASSKGIVSSLTGLINFIMTPKSKDDDQNGMDLSPCVLIFPGITTFLSFFVVHHRLFECSGSSIPFIVTDVGCQSNEPYPG